MSTIYVDNIAPKTVSGTITIDSSSPISINNTDEASSITVASLQTDGGLGVVLDARIGGDLFVTGNIINTVTSVKTTTGSIATSETVVLCGHATNDITLTLHTAVGNVGKIVYIKNVTATTVTIEGNGTETIDGSLNKTLSAQYESLTLISDNSNWYII